MKDSLKVTLMLLGFLALGAVVMAQSSDRVSSSLLNVSKSAPAEVAVGDTIEVTTTVTAEQPIANLVVTDQVPGGASLVETRPKAEVNGANVKWVVDTMDAGQTQTFTMVLTAGKEGELKYCGTVKADPRVCIVTNAGKPVLEIAKSGPEQVLLGQNIRYAIVVSNTGTSVARNVVLTDIVPDGLSHDSGNKRLAINVGDLAPGASREVPIVLKADQRGRFCNRAVAKADNTPEVSDDACTQVVEQGLDIEKTTDKPMQFVPKTAGYTVVVRNTGDVALNDVVVTDTAPAGTTVTEAAGGSVNGQVVTWTIGTLDAGAQKQFAVTLRGDLAGERCNVARVTSREGLSDQAEACTVWKGYPALLIEMVDNPDPLLMNEETTYTITVTNQGSAPDNNVRLIMTAPAQLDIVSAQGATQTTINGKVVTTAPYPTLEPKQAITWTVRAKAVQNGDARFKAAMQSDLLKTPVVEEESTQVY